MITTNTLDVTTIHDAANNYWIAQAATDQLLINCRQPLSEQMHIDITDQAGGKMIADTWLAGSTAKHINTTSFPRGSYYILLCNSTTRKVLQWTKH